MVSQHLYASGRLADLIREHENVGGMPMKTWMAGIFRTTWRCKKSMHAICGSSNQILGREELQTVALLWNEFL